VQKFRALGGGNGGQFAPPRLDKVLAALPGSNGGGEWGGPAVDPTTGVLYVNANETPRLWGLSVPRRPTSSGERVYQQRCSACHGLNRAGFPPEIPGLVGVGQRLTNQQIEDIVHQGRRRMPPFTDITATQLQPLLRYLTNRPAPADAADNPPPPAREESEDSETNSQESSRYKSIKGFFVDPDGYPGITPPWGTLSAIDLNTGKYLWQIPLGYYPELKAKGLPDTGTLNYGGPLVTAGGIVLISATDFDRKIRAFDSQTGRLLWEADLPLPGLATPATYVVNGKQYVLIATGGEDSGSQFKGPTGGIYVSFALP
jgi:quinoprotein glucose dehydrogenase